MIKLYTVLIALLLASTAVAQTEFSKFQVPLKNPSRILTAVDKQGDVCLLAFEGNGLYSTLLGPGGERISSSHLTFNHNEKIGALGLIGLQGYFIYFERVPNSDAIQPYHIEKSSGGITALTLLTPTLDEGSKLIQAYTSEDKLYTLHYSNKTRNLQVCVYKNGQEFTLLNFQTAVPKLYDRLLKGETPLFIDKNNEQTLAASSRQKKIYHEGDKIYIVIDAFGAQKMNVSNLTTEVLELNLTIETANFRALPLISKIRPIGMNSFLHQGTLYRFLITPKASIQLSAFDLGSLFLKKEFVFNSKEPLTIKSSPVSVSKKRAGEKDTTTIENTGAVLRKLGPGTATIFAENVSPDVVQLTLGNYEAASDGSVYVPNPSLLTQFGPASIPVILAVSALKVQATTTKASENYFNVYLQKDSCELTDRIPKNDLFKQISDFNRNLTEQKVPVTATFAYSYQNNIHYGFLDKSSNTIRIVAFSK
jgi:hypothetical protein